MGDLVKKERRSLTWLPHPRDVHNTVGISVSRTSPDTPFLLCVTETTPFFGLFPRTALCPSHTELTAILKRPSPGPCCPHCPASQAFSNFTIIKIQADGAPPAVFAQHFLKWERMMAGVLNPTPVPAAPACVQLPVQESPYLSPLPDANVHLPQKYPSVTAGSWDHCRQDISAPCRGNPAVPWQPGPCTEKVPLHRGFLVAGFCTGCLIPWVARYPRP